MNPLQFLVPLDWVDAIGEFIPIVLLLVVVANMLTRYLGHRKHVQWGERSDDDEKLRRYRPHVATNFLLVFGTFLFMLYRPVSGIIFAFPVVALFVADFFEFEARKVEARNNMAIELPKAALTASIVVLVYALYYGLQFLWSPYTDLIFA